MMMNAFVSDMVVMQLAFVLGAIAVVKGLWLLLNQDKAMKIIAEYRKNPDSSFLLYGGMVNVILGLIVLSMYNRWVPSFEVLITVFGWLMVIKGLILVFNPRFVVKMKMGKNYVNFGGVLSLVLGAVLLGGALRLL